MGESQHETEVWFDLVPNENGMAYDETTVPFVPVDPFVPDDGDMSIVVHVSFTKPDGTAGTAASLLPADVAKWVLDPACG